MPTLVLTLMPEPAKLRLLTTIPAELINSRPDASPLLIVARPLPEPHVPNVIGELLVPDSVDGTTIDPLKVWPSAKRTVSPCLSFWLLTRLIVFQALVVARPEAESEPLVLT